MDAQILLILAWFVIPYGLHMYRYVCAQDRRGRVIARALNMFLDSEADQKAKEDIKRELLKESAPESLREFAFRSVFGVLISTLMVAGAYLGLTWPLW